MPINKERFFLSNIDLVQHPQPNLDPLIQMIHCERRADRGTFIHPFNPLFPHQSLCSLFAGACWSCLLSRVRVGDGMEVCVFSAGGGTELRSLFLSQTDRSRGSAHIQSRVSAVSSQMYVISTCRSSAAYVHDTQEAEPNDLQLKWNICGRVWILKPVYLHSDY